MTRESSAPQDRAARFRLPLGPLVAVGLGVALLASVFVIFAARRSLAARAAEHYLALMHVPASVRIDRLDLRAVSGSVRLGTPASPDLQAHLAAVID